MLSSHLQVIDLDVDVPDSSDDENDQDSPPILSLGAFAHTLPASPVFIRQAGEVKERDHKNKQQPSVTLKSLDHTAILFSIEANLTTSEIQRLSTPTESCSLPEESKSKPFNPTESDIKAALIFFKNRWERILNTNLSYPHAHEHSTSQQCLSLASQYAPYIKRYIQEQCLVLAKKSSEKITTLNDLQDVKNFNDVESQRTTIESCLAFAKAFIPTIVDLQDLIRLEVHPFSLLMPTVNFRERDDVTSVTAVTGNDLAKLQLKDIIISDDNKSFIEVKMCFSNMAGNVLSMEATKCDILKMSELPIKDHLKKIKLSTPQSYQAYVRFGSKLFYINKLTNQCIALPVTKDILGMLDKELNPAAIANSLNEDQITLIRSKTGHALEDTPLSHTQLLDKEDKNCRLLTDEESRRVINHSSQAKHLFEAIKSFIDFKQKSKKSLGYLLEKLVQDLNKGGMNGGNGGKHFDAGAHASIAIAEFNEILAIMDEEQRNYLFSLTSPDAGSDRNTFEKIWANLDPAKRFKMTQQREMTIDDMKKLNAKRDGQCVEENAAPLQRLIDAAGRDKLLAMPIKLKLISTIEDKKNTEKKTSALLTHSCTPTPYKDLVTAKKVFEEAYETRDYKVTATYSVGNSADRLLAKKIYKEANIQNINELYTLLRLLSEREQHDFLLAFDEEKLKIIVKTTSEVEQIKRVFLSKDDQTIFSTIFDSDPTWALQSVSTIDQLLDVLTHSTLLPMTLIKQLGIERIKAMIDLQPKTLKSLTRLMEVLSPAECTEVLKAFSNEQLVALYDNSTDFLTETIPFLEAMMTQAKDRFIALFPSLPATQLDGFLRTHNVAFICKLFDTLPSALSSSFLMQSRSSKHWFYAGSNVISRNYLASLLTEEQRYEFLNRLPLETKEDVSRLHAIFPNLLQLFECKLPADKKDAFVTKLINNDEWLQLAIRGINHQEFRISLSYLDPTKIVAMFKSETWNWLSRDGRTIIATIERLVTSAETKEQTASVPQQLSQFITNINLLSLSEATFQIMITELTPASRKKLYAAVIDNIQSSCQSWAEKASMLDKFIYHLAYEEYTKSFITGLGINWLKQLFAESKTTDTNFSILKCFIDHDKDRFIELVLQMTSVALTNVISRPYHIEMILDNIPQEQRYALLMKLNCKDFSDALRGLFISNINLFENKYLLPLTPEQRFAFLNQLDIHLLTNFFFIDLKYLQQLPPSKKPEMLKRLMTSTDWVKKIIADKTALLELLYEIADPSAVFQLALQNPTIRDDNTIMASIISHLANADKPLEPESKTQSPSLLCTFLREDPGLLTNPPRLCYISEQLEIKNRMKFYASLLKQQHPNKYIRLTSVVHIFNTAETSWLIQLLNNTYKDNITECRLIFERLATYAIHKCIGIALGMEPNQLSNLITTEKMLNDILNLTRPETRAIDLLLKLDTQVLTKIITNGETLRKLIKAGTPKQLKELRSKFKPEAFQAIFIKNVADLEHIEQTAECKETLYQQCFASQQWVDSAINDQKSYSSILSHLHHLRDDAVLPLLQRHLKIKIDDFAAAKFIARLTSSNAPTSAIITILQHAGIINPKMQMIIPPVFDLTRLKNVILELKPEEVKQVYLAIMSYQPSLEPQESIHTSVVKIFETDFSLINAIFSRLPIDDRYWFIKEFSTGYLTSKIISHEDLLAVLDNLPAEERYRFLSQFENSYLYKFIRNKERLNQYLAQLGAANNYPLWQRLDIRHLYSIKDLPTLLNLFGNQDDRLNVLKSFTRQWWRTIDDGIFSLQNKISRRDGAYLGPILAALDQQHTALFIDYLFQMFIHDASQYNEANFNLIYACQTEFFKKQADTPCPLTNQCRQVMREINTYLEQHPETGIALLTEVSMRTMRVLFNPTDQENLQAYDHALKQLPGSCKPIMAAGCTLIGLACIITAVVSTPALLCFTGLIVIGMLSLLAAKKCYETTGLAKTANSFFESAKTRRPLCHPERSEGSLSLSRA